MTDSLVNVTLLIHPSIFLLLIQHQDIINAPYKYTTLDILSVFLNVHLQIIIHPSWKIASNSWS